MYQKLQSKGFVVNPQNPEFLTGEFNGTQVNIGVATNNNMVWRIMVIDAEPIDERTIKHLNEEQVNENIVPEEYFKVRKREINK